MKKERTSSKFVSGITDWRVFKIEGEELSDFNKRFNIWLASFDDIDEIPDWREQLIQSVKFTTLWFSENATNEKLVKKSWYPSLIILAENGNKELLEHRYKEMKEIEWKKQKHPEDTLELDLFWEYLNKSL